MYSNEARQFQIQTTSSWHITEHYVMHSNKAGNESPGILSHYLT